MSGMLGGHKNNKYLSLNGLQTHIQGQRPPPGAVIKMVVNKDKKVTIELIEIRYLFFQFLISDFLEKKSLTLQCFEIIAN